MRLRSINENFLSQKMREAIITSKTANERSISLMADTLHEPTSGHDAVAPGQVSGVPKKPRYRSYFGMETRPGSIRL